MYRGTYAGGTYEVFAVKNGKRWDKSNAAWLFNCISSVRAKVAAGMNAEISIVFNPPFQDAVYALESGILGITENRAAEPTKGAQQKSVSPQAPSPPTTGKPQKAVANASVWAVRFLYPQGDDGEGSTVWYAGQSTGPAITFDGSTIELTVHVSGVPSLLGILGGSYIANSRPALDVITELAKVVGVQIIFRAKDTATQAYLQGKIVSYAWNGNYMGLIRKILLDLRCSWVNTSADSGKPGSQLMVTYDDVKNQTEVKYHFVALRQIAPSSGVIPVLQMSMQPPTTLFTAGGVFGTFRADLLTAEKRVERTGSKFDDFKAKTNYQSKSDGGAVPEDSGDGDEIDVATGVKNEPTAPVSGHSADDVSRQDSTPGEAQTGRAEKSRQEVTDSTVTTPGLPSITALDKINLVVGSGQAGFSAFSGVFIVQEVEHVADDSGWTSAMTLHKIGGPTTNPQAVPEPEELPEVPDGKVGVKAKEI